MGARATLVLGTVWGLVLTYGVVTLYLFNPDPARIPVALLTFGIAFACILLLCGARRALLFLPLAATLVLLGLTIPSIPTLFSDPYADPIFFLVTVPPGLLFAYGAMKILSMPKGD